MKIPYVIDNQASRMADILNGLLGTHKGQSLDVATAYFTVGGYQLLQEGLGKLENFRLILGTEPHPLHCEIPFRNNDFSRKIDGRNLQYIL